LKNQTGEKVVVHQGRRLALEADPASAAKPENWVERGKS
jgi:hypothetical protein